MRKWLVIASLAIMSGVQAGDFTALPEGAIRHDASGWVFPQVVGEFRRAAEPVFAPNTRDAVAQYERSANNLRIAATVYVYPSDSNAGDASLADAKRAIEQSLKTAPLAQSWSEGPFRASQSPELVGEKVFYKIGIGPESTQTNLYYFDTGKWVVKFRLSPQKTEKGTFQMLDAFVRDQRWPELKLTSESCTGSACRVARPLPAHGAMPEQISILMVRSRLKEVFPSKPPACDSSALVPVLTAPEVPHVAPDLVRVVTSCSPRKGVAVSFLRVDLDQEIRDSIDKQSPDGLSLRGPITFVVKSDGKASIYTQMVDGQLDDAMVKQMFDGIDAESAKVFAKADRRGKDPQVEIRFIQ